MPAMSADWSISPESLVSRPTAILGRSTPFSMRNTAYAEPRRIAASGVIMPWFAMSAHSSVPKNCLFFPFASFKRATSQSKIYILVRCLFYSTEVTETCSGSVLTTWKPGLRPRTSTGSSVCCETMFDTST